MKADGKLARALLGAGLLALGGCASSVSTSGFKGEQHEVAQAIANLQSDVTAGDQQKVCADDLAAAVVARLARSPGGCKQAVKGQLQEVDNLEVKVPSVAISAPARAHGGHPTATASVLSIYEGKTRAGMVSLVKEGGRWRISAVS